MLKNDKPKEETEAPDPIELLMRKQKMDSLTSKMAENLLTLIRNFVVIPFLIMGVTFLIFSWFHSYPDITYLQALVITILTNIIHKFSRRD